MCLCYQLLASYVIIFKLCTVANTTCDSYIVYVGQKGEKGEKGPNGTNGARGKQTFSHYVH